MTPASSACRSRSPREACPAGRGTASRRRGPLRTSRRHIDHQRVEAWQTPWDRGCTASRSLTNVAPGARRRPEARVNDSSGMLLRPAGPADAGAIAALHLASWRAAYRAGLPGHFLEAVSAEEHRVLWLERMARPDSRVVLLEGTGRRRPAGVRRERPDAGRRRLRGGGMGAVQPARGSRPQGWRPGQPALHRHPGPCAPVGARHAEPVGGGEQRARTPVLREIRDATGRRHPDPRARPGRGASRGPLPSDALMSFG